jgi:hypothetical protein
MKSERICARFFLETWPIFSPLAAASGLICRLSVPDSDDSRSGSDRPHRGDILPDLLDQLFAAGKFPHVADAFQ